MIRREVREFVGTGIMSGNCFHSGVDLTKFLPMESYIEFGKPFEVVWKIQSKYIDVLKVCIIVFVYLYIYRLYS